MKSVATHVFQLGEVDRSGLHPVERCAECHLPRSNRRHGDLPANPAAEQEARRLGETDKENETE